MKRNLNAKYGTNKDIRVLVVCYGFYWFIVGVYINILITQLYGYDFIKLIFINICRLVKFH
jgi:hypothetical protein